MTTGPPLYLVSACGSAEEFVAAFWRYADRTGLFVPSAAPLPAGRRGRLAITLKDGGVMIEGEAEILQSSAKPTVLHGRPGMTVKFVEPDEPSKMVIAELEKARLALKPAPPSVAPRPADIPATPRPAVPTPGGRIDAANALAECVIIGDPSTLRETAVAPRGPGDGKFVVPAIPAVGAPRPKTPSTSPDAAPRPKTPSTSPEAGKATTPSAEPGAKPPVASPAAQRLTSIGFPALDKLPAAPASGRVAATPATAQPDPARIASAGPATSAGSSAVATSATSAGSSAVATSATSASSSAVATSATNASSGAVAASPAASTASSGVAERTPTAERTPADDGTAPTTPAMPPQSPLLETLHGHKPARADATPPRFSVAATAPAAGGRGAPAAPSVHEAPTKVGPGQHAPAAADVHEAPTKVHDAPTKVGPGVAAKSIFEPIVDDEATSIGAAPFKRPTDPMPTAVPIATTPEPGGSARSELNKNHKATSIGFPAMRTPFKTQPIGVVASASSAPATPPAEVPSEPAPPTLPATARPQQPARARGKNPTAPPLTPRHPTPVAPVPIIRLPSRAAPAPAADEERTDLASIPTTPAAPLDIPASEDSGSAPKPAPTHRSGGMRASEILAAIPAGDWTMSPDELVPHVLPPEAKIAAPAASAPTDANDASEPSPAPAEPPKGPPTGDWTISLDPEKGWSQPETVAKSAPVPPASNPAPKSGNPVHAVASEKPINVVQWDDKPTSVAESKIEIDATLMEPLQAMPSLDDASASDAMPAPRLSAEALPPPPMPPPMAGAMASPPVPYPMPSPPVPYPMPSAPPQYPMPALDLGGFGAPPPIVPAQAPTKRRKMILLAIAAGAIAIGAIVILVVTLGKTKATAQPSAGPGSGSDSTGSAHATAPHEAAAVGRPAASGSGSAQTTDEPAGSADAKAAPAVAPPTAEVPPTAVDAPPASAGPCTVAITSSPSGAEVVLDDKTLGTTPGTIELPCGTPAKLTLRKKPFPSTVKTFTPVAGKPNKLAVKLTRPMFLVKVTSTPMGATIKVNGRSLGVTPTTIKLPGFDTTTITLTKPGFAPTNERVTPKSNNTSEHVTLKKGKGR